MSVGTGIFLAGLIIGLVMLYGHTKDRWDWGRIAKYFKIAFVVLVLLPLGYLFHDAFGMKVTDADWSPRGILILVLTLFAILTIAGAPFFILQKFYEVVLEKNFEFDDDWNERLIFKVATWLFQILVLLLIFFGSELIRDVFGALI